MTKVQSGLVFIGFGVVMNVLGRPIILLTRSNPNLAIAIVMALWMIGSVVLVLFGIFRLVSGLIAKGRSPKIE